MEVVSGESSLIGCGVFETFIVLRVVR